MTISSLVKIWKISHCVFSVSHSIYILYNKVVYTVSPTYSELFVTCSLENLITLLIVLLTIVVAFFLICLHDYYETVDIFTK